MKNKDYKVVNIYTQANGEKIAVSMLKCTKKSFWVDIAPTTEVEKYGKIEGEIVSHWGKLPVVLVTVPEFKALKKEYEVEEYRAPYYRQSEREKKPRPDAAALKLYKVFATDEANPQRDEDGNFIKITVDNYTFYSGEGTWMLKELKRNFNFTKADIAAALALNIDEPQQQPEPAAAPVADAAAVVFTDSMDDAIEARTAEAVELPAWAVDGVRCVYDSRDNGKLTGTADRFHWSAVGHCWLCDFTDGRASIIGALVERMTPEPVQDQQPDTDDPAAVDAHFADLAAHAPADDPAADMDATPAGEKTAKQLEEERVEKVIYDYETTGIFPRWYVPNLHCESNYLFNCDVLSWGRKQIKVKNLETGKNKIFKADWFIRVVEYGSYIVSMPYDAEYMASLKQPTPTEQKTAPTDAEVLATAARIRANYEAMQADIEAEREQAAAAFAEAITAYCEELEQPAPLAWEPETIIVPFTPMAAEVEQQPRRRHRLNLRPRLSRWLHPVRWVAVAFVVCLLSGLLLGMNTSTAADAAADDIAAAYDLDPVTVTAETSDTFIEDEAPCLIEDKAPRLIEDKAPRLIEDKAPRLIEDKASAPSPVKKLAAPSPVKNVAEAAECSSQKNDAADSPAGEKTASPMATATDADGLTICEGTPWAYTMMNWA